MTVHNNDKPMIRTVRAEDAMAIFALQHEIVDEGEYFIAVSEEYHKTLEQQRELIQNLLASDSSIMLVAEIDGEVVGLVVFSSQRLKRLSHTGSISMMINKEHRNRGLGGLLLTEFLAWAEQHPRIEKVSLGVFSTNHRAIALYKKMGFVEEGRKIKEFKVGENEYIDDVLMSKFV